MSWKCDICGRLFVRTNQSHSCNSRTLEDAFAGNYVQWLPLYSELKEKAEERLGGFTEFFPSVGVMWKHASTFAEVKCKKETMDIVFYSDKLHRDRNPQKHLQTSKNRVAHLISVKNNAGLDKIIDWIEESYLLTNNMAERASGVFPANIPAELLLVFDELPEAKIIFENMALSYKKEIIQHIGEAKKEETRINRALKLARAMIDGKLRGTKRQ